MKLNLTMRKKIAFLVSKRLRVNVDHIRDATKIVDCIHSLQAYELSRLKNQIR
jgi:hypothetical protein